MAATNPKGAGRKNRPKEVTARRAKITKLYLSGWLQKDIAAECKISQAQVSQDLKFIHGEWVKSALTDFDEIKAGELAKIDRLERENWEAWERSMTERVKTRETIFRTNTTETMTETVTPVGDPRFLQGVQWCISKRCEIFGLDAPKKLDHTSGGQPMKPTIIVNDPATGEQIDKLIKGANH